MAMHRRHFQQPQHQPQPSRNLLTVDNQMTGPVSFFDTASFGDQSHPQYIPPSGFVPAVIPAGNAANGGCSGDLRWINYHQLKKKRLKEEDLLDKNQNESQTPSSAGFLRTRPVSTGLGLSLDVRRIGSTGGTPISSHLLEEEINLEFQREDAELDRLIKVQGEQLRLAILKKLQTDQLQTLSLLEERILQKLRKKDAQIEDINKKNNELKEQMKHLSVEVGSWKQQAKYNENMAKALKINLDQVFAQSRDSKEGCGDSEVDDTASCCNGVPVDFHLGHKENKELKDSTVCKICGVNEVCMLLLPCRHLCLCKDCESKLSFCPLCQTSKFIGMEVYM